MSPPTFRAETHPGLHLALQVHSAAGILDAAAGQLAALANQTDDGALTVAAIYARQLAHRADGLSHVVRQQIEARS